MATALLHEAAEELPTLGTSLGLGSQVAPALGPTVLGHPLGASGPGWRECQSSRSPGTGTISEQGAEIRQGPDKGQTDLQTGCQKQER